jgi:hypothetical protein
MPSFTDDKGREWHVSLNINKARAIRERLGVNILNVEGLDTLAQDVVLLVDVLFLLCEDQLRARGVNDLEFGESLSGMSLQSGSDAMIQALLDFSPPRQQKVLRQLHQTWVTLHDMLAGQVTEIQEKQLKKAMALMSGVSSPDTPESSDLTPAP